MNAIVQTTLDILRDTADDIEREGDIDTTTTRLVIRASATTLESEIKRLRAEVEMLLAAICEAARDEREACAKVCDPTNADMPADWTEYAKTKAKCAANIRKR